MQSFYEKIGIISLLDEDNVSNFYVNLKYIQFKCEFKINSIQMSIFVLLL